jgi:hypothetical protein
MELDIPLPTGFTPDEQQPVTVTVSGKGNKNNNENTSSSSSLPSKILRTVTNFASSFSSSSASTEAVAEIASVVSIGDESMDTSKSNRVSLANRTVEMESGSDNSDSGFNIEKCNSKYLFYFHSRKINCLLFVLVSLFQSSWPQMKLPSSNSNEESINKEIDIKDALKVC